MTEKQKNKKLCRYGDTCYRKNQAHMEDYYHEIQKEETNENLKENICNERNIKKNLINKNNEEDIIDKEVSNKNIDLKSKNEYEGNTQKSEDCYDLSEIKDIKEFVFENNKMHMPDDFYEIIEFCRSIDSKNPKNALKSINIELTGIYDLILLGLKTDYKIHSRYFYDPPEFQTVLKVNKSETLLHFGYFRDDPNEMPIVAINEAKIDGKIISKGDNLFSALNWYIEELISGSINSDASKEVLNDIKNKLINWFEKHHGKEKKISLQLKTPRIKAREKKINCKTLHQIGIVVPVDSKGFGYRDVPDNIENQKKMFTNYCLKDESKKPLKSKADEKIQEIITLIQFANDETDYGMGLEFGLNMFAFGDLGLHKYIKAILPICYDLLGRSYFAEILKEHLKNRKTIDELICL